jgi:hypothetical protein
MRTAKQIQEDAQLHHDILARPVALFDGLAPRIAFVVRVASTIANRTSSSLMYFSSFSISVAPSDGNWSRMIGASP